MLWCVDMIATWTCEKYFDLYLFGAMNFTYKLYFRCMSAHWKDLNEKDKIILGM